MRWAAVAVLVPGCILSSPAMYSPAEGLAPAPAAADSAKPAQPGHVFHIDELAKRFESHQDVYEKLRDEAIATYNRNHPDPQPFDDLARPSFKLLAYLWVWGDRYGEGFWGQLTARAGKLRKLDTGDPVWPALPVFCWHDRWRSNDDKEALSITAEQEAMGQSDYPAALRFWAYSAALINLANAKWDTSVQPPLSTSLSAMPALAEKATSAFRELVQQGVPDDILFRKGMDLLSDTQKDEPTLKALNAGFDAAFGADPSHELVKGALDGAFDVDEAWNARGHGYADSVTPQGWQTFAERLQQADTILEPLYAKYPDEEMVPEVMMSVVLGRQQDRNTMETWFQRGIKADPNAWDMYIDKMVYLLPRWYGSSEELWKFGMECAQSTNWQGKVPMMLPRTLIDAGKDDHSIYARSDLWDPLEKVYRAYLDHYPNAIIERSRFAKQAAFGGHWAVAEEQFKIMGNNWSHEVFTDEEYARISRQAAQDGAGP